MSFGREYGFRIGFGRYVKLIIGGPVYSVVPAAAALRAVWREYTGRRDREITSHVGAQLTPQTTRLSTQLTPQPQEAP